MSNIQYGTCDRNILGSLATVEIIWWMPYVHSDIIPNP